MRCLTDKMYVMDTDVSALSSTLDCNMCMKPAQSNVCVADASSQDYCVSTWAYLEH